jgi:hypothetical protein
LGGCILAGQSSRFGKRSFIIGTWPIRGSHLIFTSFTSTSSAIAIARLRARKRWRTGCAPRWVELAALTKEDIQQREGRWVIADLHGKGGRIRTLAIPMWVKLCRKNGGDLEQIKFLLGHASIQTTER